jgi:hypothetical protein
MTPPILQPAFQTIITNYFNARAAYNQGGLGQKGPFNDAKKAIFEALDEMGAYVDTIALGDPNIITLAGYVPTKGGKTKAPKPVQCTGVKVKNPETGKMVAECAAQDYVTSYVCIVTAGEPLPSVITISGTGQMLLDTPTGPQPVPQPEGAIIDFTTKRIKTFLNLTPTVRYYFAFFAINSTGVGGISLPVSKVCD